MKVNVLENLINILATKIQTKVFNNLNNKNARPIINAAITITFYGLNLSLINLIKIFIQI